MDSNLLYDAILSKITGPRKQTPNGWLSYNGVCCIHNGQSRNDTRKRAGVKITSEGVTISHCFNCSYTASWQPGRLISRKMENLLQWLGTNTDEYKKLHFKAWQIKQRTEVSEPVKEWFAFDFEEKSLPSQAKPLSYWAEQQEHSDDLLNVLQYLANRGDHLLYAVDYYWSPETTNDLNKRLIIPFKWKNKTVGWTSRAIFPTKHKYLSSMSNNYIFNTEMIKSEHQYIIVCEGPFDALTVGGVAVLGNHVSINQSKWFNSTGKKIVVVPDREFSGENLVNTAIHNNWYVSFPKWDKGVKDSAEAGKYYGKLYTLWSIISAITNDPLEIKVKRNLDLQNLA